MIELISDFVVNYNASDIPKNALEVAKNCFLDCLGVSLAGVQQDESQIITEVVRSWSGETESGVILSNFKCPSPFAALANGTIAHALDFDDISTTFLAHPSVNLIPPILALAESHNISGRDALTAYVIGYEVCANLGAMMGVRFFSRNWHATSLLGCIAAAVVSSRILRLNVKQTRMAIGIASSLAAGLKINFGTMTKPLHIGNACQTGILAALLAGNGFNANESALEGSSGLHP